jgi:serine/threonine protein kinase
MFAFDAAFALKTLANVAQGLQFLHGAAPPLLHCDLKSPNVLIDRNFVAKLADIAFPRQNRRRGPQGTPFWMAPECLLGGGNSSASDMYSYGVVIYECLARRAPYDESDPRQEDLLQAIAAGERLLSAPPGCSFELVALMNECLNLDAVKRPAAGEVGRRLSCLNPASTTAPSFTDPDREPGPSLWPGKMAGSSRWRNGQKEEVSKSEMIMRSLFPQDVSDALLRGERVPPESKAQVTMYFRSAPRACFRDARTPWIQPL